MKITEFGAKQLFAKENDLKTEKLSAKESQEKLTRQLNDTIAFEFDKIWSNIQLEAALKRNNIEEAVEIATASFKKTVAYKEAQTKPDLVINSSRVQKHVFQSAVFHST